jgi:hypothetical protein
MIVFISPNQPAAGKAGIARLLTIEHPWPAVGEPEFDDIVCSAA